MILNGVDKCLIKSKQTKSKQRVEEEINWGLTFVDWYLRKKQNEQEDSNVHYVFTPVNKQVELILKVNWVVNNFSRSLKH